MVRLLVQVRLPEKELQLAASPPAAKQQSSAPRAAVFVSAASCRNCFRRMAVLCVSV